MSELSQPDPTDELIKLLYGYSFLHFIAIMLILTLFPPSQYFLTPYSRVGWHATKKKKTDKNPCLLEHFRGEEINNHKDREYVRG